MKRKIFMLLFSICMLIPMGFLFAGCKQEPKLQIEYDYSNLLKFDSYDNSNQDYSPIINIADYFQNYKAEESVTKGSEITLPKTLSINSYGRVIWKEKNLLTTFNDGDIIETDIVLVASWEQTPTIALIREDISIINFENMRLLHWDGLNTINIPDNIVSIEDGLFQNCSDLQIVNINPTSSLEKIGNYTFAGCDDLRSISLPDSLKEIGSQAFARTGLKTITIPKNVEDIGIGALGGCTDLTSIVVDPLNNYYDSRNNCNAIIVTDTNYLISGCKLTDIPSSVEVISNYAFYQHWDLEHIEIPEGVTGIRDNAFLACEYLKSIILPKSIEYLSDKIFGGFSSHRPSLICYSGTLEELNNVEFDELYDNMREYIYIYSKYEPTDTINYRRYWHYDTSGHPVAWEL